MGYSILPVKYNILVNNPDSEKYNVWCTVQSQKNTISLEYSTELEYFLKSDPEKIK